MRLASGPKGLTLAPVLALIHLLLCGQVLTFLKSYVILCQPCNQSSFRQRSADPIRQPAEEGRACPDAVEKEPCNLNKNCFHYDYNVTGT